MLRRRAQRLLDRVVFGRPVSDEAPLPLVEGAWPQGIRLTTFRHGDRRHRDELASGDARLSTCSADTGRARYGPTSRNQETELILITVKTKVKPGSADAYLAANRPFLDATRQEPGN